VRGTRALAGAFVAAALAAGAGAYAGCANLDAVLVKVDGGGTSPPGVACPPPLPPQGTFRYTTGQGLPVVETLLLGDAGVPIEVGPDFDGELRHTPGGYTMLLRLGGNHTATLKFDQATSGVNVPGWEEVVYGNKSLVSCGPPALTWNPCDRAQQAWPIACTGENSLVDGGFNVVGAHRLVGESSVVVGGATIAALHFADARTVQGTQQGKQDLEWWLRKEDGLLLRHIVSTRVSSPSPIGGTATYAVNLDFRLQSVAPDPLP
jgi:hypothetical protein